MPFPRPSIEEQLQQLQNLAQAAVADELPSAPQWIADASLDALDKIRALRIMAGINLALLPKGNDLRMHLGANWVDLHETVYELVEIISKSLDDLRASAE